MQMIIVGMPVSIFGILDAAEMVAMLKEVPGDWPQAKVVFKRSSTSSQGIVIKQPRVDLSLLSLDLMDKSFVHPDGISLHEIMNFGLAQNAGSCSGCKKVCRFRI